MRRASPFLAMAFVLCITIPAASAQSKPSEASETESTCVTTMEDYAVYSAILKNLGHPEDPEEEWRDKSQFILLDRTTVSGDQGFSGTNVWGFRSKSKQAPTPENPRSTQSKGQGIMRSESISRSLSYLYGDSRERVLAALQETRPWRWLGEVLCEISQFIRIVERFGGWLQQGRR